MLKIEKNGNVMKLEVGGGLNEICIDLCYAISAIHQGIGKDSPEMGKAFRACMTAAVTVPESPAWGPLENATIIEIDKDALGKGCGQ